MESALSPSTLPLLGILRGSRKRVAGASNAILVTCVSSLIFRSDVISTFEMPVLL